MTGDSIITDTSDWGAERCHIVIVYFANARILTCVWNCAYYTHSVVLYGTCMTEMLQVIIIKNIAIIAKNQLF